MRGIELSATNPCRVMARERARPEQEQEMSPLNPALQDKDWRKQCEDHNMLR